MLAASVTVFIKTCMEGLSLNLQLSSYVTTPTYEVMRDFPKPTTLLTPQIHCTTHQQFNLRR